MQAEIRPVGHVRLRILLGRVLHALSQIVPVHYTTEFGAHTGVPWRAWWWQWRGRTFCKGGRPIGPRNAALGFPCACHDAEGRRIRPWEEVHG